MARDRDFPSDDELLERIRAQDEEAEYQFTEKHTALVNGVVGRTLWRAKCDHYQDVCVEAWVRVFKEIKKGGEINKLSGLIARIAINESCRHLRKVHKRQPEMPLESVDSRLLIARGTSTEEEIEAADLLGKAIAKVAVTKPKFPEIFDLRMDGFSYEEIADVVCETPEKAKYIYFQGLHELRRILKDEFGGRTTARESKH